MSPPSGSVWVGKFAGDGGETCDSGPVAALDRVGRREPGAADAADVGQREVRRRVRRGDAAGRAEPRGRARGRRSHVGTPRRPRPRPGRTSSRCSRPPAAPRPRRRWRRRAGTAVRCRAWPPAGRRAAGGDQELRARGQLPAWPGRCRRWCRRRPGSRAPRRRSLDRVQRHGGAQRQLDDGQAAGDQRPGDRHRVGARRARPRPG